jgi:hypothetical protein
MIGHLVHHAGVIALEGDSYRLRPRPWPRPSRTNRRQMNPSCKTSVGRRLVNFRWPLTCVDATDAITRERDRSARRHHTGRGTLVDGSGALQSLADSYGLFFDPSWVPDLMERYELRSPFE